MANLIRVWKSNIGDPTYPVNLFALYADEGHQNNKTYANLRREPYAGSYLATNFSNPQMAYGIDDDHLPSIIWQLAFITTNGGGGMPQSLSLPTPARTYEGRTINGLNLLNGERRIKGWVHNWYWPQRAQTFGHIQWGDITRFRGSKATYNAIFVPRGRPSLDEHWGAAPVWQTDGTTLNRPSSGAYVSDSPSVIEYTIKFDPMEMVDLEARPDKLYSSGYNRIGESLDARIDMFHRGTVENIHLLQHVLDIGSGPYPPTPQPPAYSPPAQQPPYGPGGTTGILYILSDEVWADSDLNPNAIPV